MSILILLPVFQKYLAFTHLALIDEGKAAIFLLHNSIFTLNIYLYSVYILQKLAPTNGIFATLILLVHKTLPLMPTGDSEVQKEVFQRQKENQLEGRYPLAENKIMECTKYLFVTPTQSPDDFNYGHYYFVTVICLPLGINQLSTSVKSYC